MRYGSTSAIRLSTAKRRSPAGHDVGAPVRQRRFGDDLRLGSDGIRFRARADLAAVSDENDAEGTLPLDAAADQQAVARLEDMERHERAREQHGFEGEERKEFAHASTVLWRSVTTG